MGFLRGYHLPWMVRDDADIAAEIARTATTISDDGHGQCFAMFHQEPS